MFLSQLFHLSNYSHFSVCFLFPTPITFFSSGCFCSFHYMNLQRSSNTNAWFFYQVIIYKKKILNFRCYLISYNFLAPITFPEFPRSRVFIFKFFFFHFQVMALLCCLYLTPAWPQVMGMAMWAGALRGAGAPTTPPGTGTPWPTSTPATGADGATCTKPHWSDIKGKKKQDNPA